MVSPMPSSSRTPIPTALFTAPVRGGPASVTPRCSGYSILSAIARLAAIMVGGSEAFIETLIRLKSSDSRMWMWPSAALTMAVTTSSIGGRTPAPSLGRPGSDPALTPIRIGISRSLARDANDATPRVFEAGDLVECRFDIARVRLRHRLHHDRRGASDDNVADAN